MLEPSGTLKLLVVDSEIGEEEEVVLTGKDFHTERRSMLDDEVLRDDDEGEHVAYASGLGFDFKVVATPPRQIDIEEEPEEIRVEIVEKNLDFDEPQDDGGEAEG
ncbi:conserved hypothetical protein [Burkholderia sp. 8Y]|uniref:hypothetical protein n=1 Tax=Burkholderia sp. 8Y TaxID=2653133 RepID=UPI0012F1E98A|nr:hypothetical protein [Burkholderia sp. 8Y]VXC51481.1 conserved hypothetical protein [Burkholderia sp. 8Y]